MQFYFIRHAQSTNNALMTDTGSEGGRSEDPELTEIGWRQAEILADFLKEGDPRGGRECNGGEPRGFDITHLYSSLMIRAVATGTEIAKKTGVPLNAWMEIHECGGIYLDDADSGERIGLSGGNRLFFQERFPNFILPEDLGEDGWWNHQPFEAREARTPRARRFLAGLLERHGGTGDRVAVISHGGFYNHIIAALLDLPREGTIWLTMYNAGITRIDFEGERPSIVYSNRIDFLPPDLIT